jgi:hypothetical protein
MDIFTVSFFGHREISNPYEAEKQLENIAGSLIRSKEYVEFLVGRDGEFDQLASSTIRRTVRTYGSGNASLILVLPYATAEYRDNEKSFLDYYDDVEICPEAAESHFKAAIQVRNRCMIDRSDLVVCCIERRSGGAYKSVKYAEKTGRKIINVAELLG